MIKILVVDDESVNLDIVSDFILDDNEEYDVLQASDGEEALKIIEEEGDMDLVLTDWNMPVMSGLELVKKIKSEEHLKHIPVLMQTANTTPAELKQAFEAGVMDYIRKPVEAVELLARVRSALELSFEKRKTEALLLKMFPKEVAEELKEKDDATPKYFSLTTIMFADIKGYSSTARRMKDRPEDLVKQLDIYFEKFDDIMVKYGIERIKTIGDCYMAVAGVPKFTPNHALIMTLAALEMQQYMIAQTNSSSEEAWQVRLGINTGDLVAGVIGKVKFAYDVWGDSVNLASRMESTGEVERIHISEDTYTIIKDYFECEKRAELVKAKNMGEVQTYFVNRLKPEYSADEPGFVPNDQLIESLTKS